MPQSDQTPTDADDVGGFPNPPDDSDRVAHECGFVEPDVLKDTLTPIMNAIARERNYQNVLFGAECRSVGDYLLIALEELGESVKAWNDHDRDESLVELLQVVAVVVACLQQHGIVERDWTAAAVKVRLRLKLPPDAEVGL